MVPCVSVDNLMGKIFCLRLPPRLATVIAGFFAENLLFFLGFCV